MESRKPALMLPYGIADYQSGERLNFMKLVRKKLHSCNWTIGFELKGAVISNWALEACVEIRRLNGRITWHWPQSVSKQMINGLTDEIRLMAETANQLRVYGLEAIVLHCAPVVAIDPPEDMGLERYNSPIGARDMLEHIKKQVAILKELNELCGGILCIENVDIIQFREGGYRVPTYLALQTGCWSDLAWLAKAAGINTVFDSEHFKGASNLLCRKGEENFRHFPNISSEMQKDEAIDALANIAGYFLVEGLPPQGCVDIPYTSRIDNLAPRLFHLGGSIRAVDDNNRIDTHLPSWDAPMARSILDYELLYIESHPECIGAVVEVTGQLEPDKYSTWSPRPKNDEMAKWMATLEVIDALHNLKRS